MAIQTLLRGGVTQREIERFTGLDRKTIRRRYQRQANSPGVATGADAATEQIPPPRPPATGTTTSACELAPNSPLRVAVTALAPAASAAPPAAIAEPAAEPAHRHAARYAWALLHSRVYEVFRCCAPTAGA